MKYLVSGEYPDFNGNEIWWDAILMYIEEENPNGKEVFLVELMEEKLIKDPVDEFNILSKLQTIYRFKFENISSLQTVVGEKDFEAIELELKEFDHFEYAGFLYCDNKFCTFVVQE